MSNIPWNELTISNLPDFDYMFDQEIKRLQEKKFKRDQAWFQYQEFKYIKFRCNKCRNSFIGAEDSDILTWQYCPYCGTKINDEGEK